MKDLLSHKIYSWDNLVLAYRKASKGKRGNPNVAAFEHRLEDNLIALQNELKTQTYNPGKYVNFFIHEPKKRLISAAPFRDRVVHHALCNIIEPIFERTFIYDSYANRIGKGTHKALNRCQQFLRIYPYVLVCDVQQFFPSIDHSILKSIIARKIKDTYILWFIEMILKSGESVLGDVYDMVYFPDDDLFAITRARGLPIGNLTSQLWSNVYLNPFDHFIKRQLRCPAYLRFVDDCLLFAHNKITLWQYKEAIEKYLIRLRLKIHPCHPTPVTEGVPFLGFTLYASHRRLKRRKGIYFQRKFNKLLNAFSTGEIPLNKVSASVKGWVNHVRYANTIGLRKALFTRQIIFPL